MTFVCNTHGLSSVIQELERPCRGGGSDTQFFLLCNYHLNSGKKIRTIRILDVGSTCGNFKWFQIIMKGVPYKFETISRNVPSRAKLSRTASPKGSSKKILLHR